MKKRVLLIFMVFMMFFSAMPVYAAEQRVYDDADILTAEEEADLQDICETVREEWELDLAYLTTNDTKGMSVKEYGADFYMEKEFGVGSDFSGVIFVVDMTTREAQIVTCGKAIDILTDYYIEAIWNDMKAYFSYGEYYLGMVDLWKNIDYYCGEYAQYGENPATYVSPYQKESDSFLSQHQVSKGTSILMFLGVPAFFSLVIAGIAVASMRRSCKNVRPFTDGRAYLKENGCHLTVDQDTFANTHTSMVPIPRDDDDHHHHHSSGGSWGGGSHTFSHGGRSFGGGGGKF